ncbi:MAG: glycosyl hydrolase family 17 [Bacteroidetes bacterium MedPE-SWsnd-G1]|nr:MAG: glycosyl hydrolase family 17 [Bacteroidetes bacterium MedPE-SWsnd-G1]
MKKILAVPYVLLFIFSLIGCSNNPKKINTVKDKTAQEILGNPNYLAMSYGGYRHSDHGIEPSIDELKEDMKLLSAIGVGILRTYKLHLPHASNLVKAIEQLKKEDPSFEMYVMLGIWIDCKNAWTDQPLNHNEESPRNAVEVSKAVELANSYPDIIKVLAVGNEAMVKWQSGYYVEPWIILKWVKHLQSLKSNGELSNDLWITSSDNFASWGGGEGQYHVPDLDTLIKEVDFISMHTYPMHDTHYNPQFWGVLEEEDGFSELAKVDAAMQRSLEYAKNQYDGVKNYMQNLGVDKPIHIGETGWATVCNNLYGQNGAKATDEYKEAVFHNLMRAWTNINNIGCFYFEGFDEPWKDANNPEGSENHFGLFTVEGKAKFALWDAVDKGVFEGLTRNGNPITKTFNGDMDALLETVHVPGIIQLHSQH